MDMFIIVIVIFSSITFLSCIHQPSRDCSRCWRSLKPFLFLPNASSRGDLDLRRSLSLSHTKTHTNTHMFSLVNALENSSTKENEKTRP
uniref:Putative secreted protein n=1 Tax=Anopheles darlingi TaxID=43151 RepID=A0A2M4DDX9_ANODA